MDQVSSDVLDRLGDRTGAIPASSFPAVTLPSRPGLYSWWADDEARAAIRAALGVDVPTMIYIGQAGAGTSGATLASRIRRNHIGGPRRGSTFRRTMAAILDAASVGKEPLTEAELTVWIQEHLSVLTVAFDDRNRLLELEDAALRRYDPPLNLMGMVRSDARSRLRALRAAARSTPIR